VSKIADGRYTYRF